MGDGLVSKVHRLFLQAVANNGSLSVTLALEILKAIHGKYGNSEIEIDETALNDTINAINEAIEEFHQSISYVRMDWNTPSVEYLVFCSTFNSTTVNLPIAYNVEECNYLKWLIELIVTNDDHCIHTISAINASTPITNTQSTSKKITKQRADDLLKEWTAAGYLYLDENYGTLTLGPRAIGEFGRQLLQSYPNALQRCAICNGLALKPLSCPNEQCESVMDNHCAGKILNKSKKCPTCKNPWAYELQQNTQ